MGLCRLFPSWASPLVTTKEIPTYTNVRRAQISGPITRCKHIKKKEKKENKLIALLSLLLLLSDSSIYVNHPSLVYSCPRRTPRETSKAGVSSRSSPALLPLYPVVIVTRMIPHCHYPRAAAVEKDVAAACGTWSLW